LSTVSVTRADSKLQPATRSMMSEKQVLIGTPP
jgi:hypothetical protein